LRKVSCWPANVVGIQRVQAVVDALGQAPFGQEGAERVRRGGEAGGHPHAMRQLRDHLAEAGVLAADRLDVGIPQVLKRYDQGGRAEKGRHGKTPEVETGSALQRIARCPASGLCDCSNGRRAGMVAGIRIIASL